MSKKEIQIPKVKLQANGTEGETEKYALRLFVTGILPNSTRAVVNLKKICEEYLKGRYELDIVDIYQQPELALVENIIAVPMLIKKFPLPETRLIGDMSNTESVLEGLNLV